MDVDPKLEPLRGAARFRRLQKRASREFSS
jgi:hypothetical protein